MGALSVELPSELELDSGLPLDEIEARLVTAAKRHHLEERNIAYWLLEIDERALHKERGFSSIGDYAMELVGIKPRKAQYLVFIASRLEKLPLIREAFDSGELSWTKAREITSVATPETEAEWLAKARALSNRDLENRVRRHAGQDAGGFVTVTISMPTEVFEMWNDAYELAERMSGSQLEKWQVLEPTLAEFLGTHLPMADESDEGDESVESDEEAGLARSVRNAIFERDGWQCAFPGCTMRKHLDLHHIRFRSRGGGDEAENLVCLWRTHHRLVHRGICTITGKVGVDLKFERPHLATEKTPEEPSPVEVEEATSSVNEDPCIDDDESWRDEAVAQLFDGPPAPKYVPRFKDYGDFIADWVEKKKASEREDRSRKRRARFRPGAHVCAETEEVDSTFDDDEASTSAVLGDPPGG